MSTVQRVNFLWDASMTLNTSAMHVDKLLKSYLRNTCRKLAGTNTAIPLERFTESQMCCSCSLHWQANDFGIKYKPQELQITTSKTKKLLKKFSDKQAGSEQVQLSRKQKIRAKWLLKRAKNRLVLDCEFCHHKTTIGLDKPDKSKKAKSIVPIKPAVTKIKATKKKNKKAKSKDKMAGLKLPKHKPELEKKLPAKHRVDTTTKTPPAKSKAKKTKTSQQKNSLLQLAALLKSQENSSINNNRLESLLK